MTSPEDTHTTRDRILLEATTIFAQKGYAAVSMRDIARRVDIKAASIYNHFESKEALWDAILEHIESMYLLYFERLEEAIGCASSFEQVLESMFVELRTIVNIFTYRGFSLVQIEQFRDERAYEIYSRSMLHFSIEFIRKHFDRCVEKGWVEAFDTHTTATFFMHSVLTGIMLRAHEALGQDTPYSVTKMFLDLQGYILRSVKIVK